MKNKLFGLFGLVFVPYSVVAGVTDFEILEKLKIYGPSVVKLKRTICEASHYGALEPGILKQLLGAKKASKKSSRASSGSNYRNFTTRMRFKTQSLSTIEIYSHKNSETDDEFHTIRYYKGAVARLRFTVVNNGKSCDYLSLERYFMGKEKRDDIVAYGLVAGNNGLATIYKNLIPLSLKEIYGEGDRLDYVRDLQKSGRIKVGMVDSGVDYNNPNFAYKLARKFSVDKEFEVLQAIKNDQQKSIYRHSMLASFDFRDGDSSPFDYEGLGMTTLVGKGGLFPSATFLPRAKDHGNQTATALLEGTDRIELTVANLVFETGSLAKSLKVLINSGVRVINMSLGYNRLQRLTNWGVKKIIKNHPEVLFVVSAGNEGKRNLKVFPANFDLPNIISVGATSRKNSEVVVADYSNYGETVTLLAPGLLTAPLPGNPEHMAHSIGTSFSAPRVSRLAALILDQRPDWSPGQVKNFICQNLAYSEHLQGKAKCPGLFDPDALMANLP